MRSLLQKIMILCGIKKFLFYSLIVLSTGLILITLLAFLSDLKSWYYKILDFPRLQYLLLGIVLLLFLILVTKKWKFASLALLIGLIVVIVSQGMVIYPYLPGKKSVPDFQVGTLETYETFGVLLANVLIDNRQSEAFLEIVRQQDPDIILVMEVDGWWLKELQILKVKYPYHLEYPLDNAYGMALYSKFPMKDQEINFLNQNDVPSFHATIVMPSGNSFNFHGIHPVAPVPSKKYPDNVGKEEVALLKIGHLVAGNQLPAMVAGDFNDVSWSNRSTMFGQSGNLKNVRTGRGLYNTFDATSIFMRWPLDHYFVSKEFKLVELLRLSKFGSDHYPFYARFVLDP